MLSLFHWQAATFADLFVAWFDTVMGVWPGAPSAIVRAEPVSPGWAP